MLGFDVFHPPFKARSATENKNLLQLNSSCSCLRKRSMLHSLIHGLYDEFSLCCGSDLVPTDQVLETVHKLREISKNKGQVESLSFKDAEQLIDVMCLNPYTATSVVDDLLTIAMANILLVNRSLLMELTMSHGMPSFYRLINYVCHISKVYLAGKEASLGLDLTNNPEAIAELQRVASNLDSRHLKLFDSPSEAANMLPKFRLFFLLFSYKIPSDQLSKFFVDVYTDLNHIYTLVLWESLQTFIHDAGEDSLRMKKIKLLIIEICKSWYAFACHYEKNVMEYSESAEFKGLRDVIDEAQVYRSKWIFFFTHVTDIGNTCYRLHKAGKFITEDRLNIKLALNIGNVLMMAHPSAYCDWVISAGIERFYPLYLMYLNICLQNLKAINYDQLYSQTTASFDFINLEILPVVAILGQFIKLADTVEIKTKGRVLNNTRAIFRYCFGGKRELGGVPEALVPFLPDLKPHCELLLREPLLVNLNKEVLGIYNTLEVPIESTFCSKTINQVDPIADLDFSCVNMTFAESYRRDSYLEERRESSATTVEEQNVEYERRHSEADDIMKILSKLSA